MSHTHPRHQKGSALLEAILALSIVAVMIVIFVSTITYAAQSSQTEIKRTQAILLAQEGLEATRNIRDANFTLLTDGAHGLSLSGNMWGFAGSDEQIDDFTRTITVEPIDAKAKHIISTVTWSVGNNPFTVTFSTILTDWAT